MTEQMLITFHGLVLWPLKIQKRADFDLWFCLFCTSYYNDFSIILRSYIKVYINIRYLNVALKMNE